MIHLSSVESSINKSISITDLVAPNVDDGRNFEPTAILDNVKVEEVLQEIAQMKEKENLDGAIVAAAGLLLLFPEMRERIPLTVDDFYEQYSSQVEVHVVETDNTRGKLIDVDLVSGFLLGFRLMFPEAATAFLEERPFIVDSVVQQLIEHERWDDTPEYNWHQAAMLSIGMGELFNTEMFFHDPNPSVAKVGNDTEPFWWERGDFSYLTEALPIWLFSPESIGVLKPPSKAWKLINDRLVSNQAILDQGPLSQQSTLFDFVYVKFLMATKVALEDGKLVVEMPVAGEKEGDESPPTSPEKFLMPTLSFLESLRKPEINIKDLAVPVDAVPSKEPWLPSELIPEDMRQKMYRGISESMSLYGPSTMASTLAILFPEHRAELPNLEQDFDSIIEGFGHLIKEDGYGSKDKVLWYLATARTFVPAKVESFLEDHPWILEEALDQFLNHRSVLLTETAMKYALYISLLTGKKIELQPGDPIPQRAQKMADVLKFPEWWKKTEVTIETLWMIRLFSPEPAAAIRPSPEDWQELLKILQESILEPSLVNFAVKALSMVLIGADEVELTSDGPRLYFKSAADTAADTAPPPRREF